MAQADVTLGSLDPGIEDRLQPLRRQLGVTSFGINLIVLQPRQRMRVHAHERQEEVYLVVEGELDLLLDGAEHRLGVGDLARVGPSTRRQLVNAGDRRLAVLALGGAGEHHSRDARAWDSWTEGGDGRQPSEVPLPPDLPAR
jgi:uncharacterized cupin superfamily protein